MSKPSEPTRDIFDTGGRALRHKGLRRSNEKTVLRVIGFNPGVSNAEISRMSGLAPQTVSAILVDLERDGLVERGEALRGRRGQPATPIQLNKNGAFAIGVELSWGHADVVLLDLRANVLGHRHIDYAFPDAHTLLDRIAGFAAELRSQLTSEQQKHLLDLGLAMPGGMAGNLSGIGADTEQVALWDRMDSAAELAQRTGLEVTLLNDGNAGCWAELIAMPQPRPSNILYLLVSHFVGAGVIGDGSLWSGQTGNAANLGSMLVQLDTGGPQEAHAIASLWALGQRLAMAGKPYDIIARADWDWTQIDAEVGEWITDSAKALAWAAFNATTVVESPLLILDSILGPKITERLVEKVRTELAALPVPGFVPPQVIAGRLGAMAPAMGAAELPLFTRYF